MAEEEEMHDKTSIKVWDPLVRLFHWGLVASFTLAYLSEDDWMNMSAEDHSEHAGHDGHNHN